MPIPFVDYEEAKKNRERIASENRKVVAKKKKRRKNDAKESTH